jgi:L-ascorbate metabolism protein UlaG (beta-lactamase superfamily)
LHKKRVSLNVYKRHVKRKDAVVNLRGALNGLLFALVLSWSVTADVGAQSAGAEGVSITFLANEGVLLSGGGRKVLIDALFLRYGPNYAVPPDSTQRVLQAARSPFELVDLILVTHRHGDHFHPAPLAAHLQSNPRAQLVTSQQVIDSLRSGGRSVPDQRLLALTTNPGSVRRETIGGVSLQLLGLPHGGERHRQVQHLGYVVELGGRRVLHVGDTEVSANAFAPLRLDTARIDVALLPAWMVTSAEGRQIIERWIRPHLSEGDDTQTARAVQEALPKAITFARKLETRRF